MARSNKALLGYALTISACVSRVDAPGATDDLEGASEALGERDSVQTDIDPRRSLAVTDEPILARFSFERVMNQLASQARVPGLSASSLFRQWWDTQNPKAYAVAKGPHCDDTIDPTLGSVINGFPYGCRPAPAEGAEATCNPFEDPSCSYFPVGLFNRFDLAPQDGSSCGEYRVVFARSSGQTNTRARNLLIFEASLPNPSPREGLRGCRDIVKFWAELSRIDDIEARADRLERFYFRGLGRSIPAVIDVRHFGDNAEGRGQVRTNQFLQDGLEARAWSLREFKLIRACDERGRRARYHEPCDLRFVPVTDKKNPYGPLFAETSSHAKKDAFQRSFVEQVSSLAEAELSDLSMNVPDDFNSAQSQSSGTAEGNLLANFEDGGPFSERIAERLEEIGSTLEPVDIVARAQTQTCAGCHRFSNNAELGEGLVWPASLGFTHVTEVNPEVVDGVQRFRISDALTSTFLPRRKEIMESFLRGRASHHRRHGRFEQYSH